MPSRMLVVWGWLSKEAGNGGGEVSDGTNLRPKEKALVVQSLYPKLTEEGTCGIYIGVLGQISHHN